MTSYVSMFADNAKIMKQVKDEEDFKMAQKDLDKMYEWSQVLEINNAKKCKLLEIGKIPKRLSQLFNGK